MDKFCYKWYNMLTLYSCLRGVFYENQKSGKIQENTQEKNIQCSFYADISSVPVRSCRISFNFGFYTACYGQMTSFCGNQLFYGRKLCFLDSFYFHNVLNAVEPSVGFPEKYNIPRCCLSDAGNSHKFFH